MKTALLFVLGLGLLTAPAEGSRMDHSGLKIQPTQAKQISFSPSLFSRFELPSHLRLSYGTAGRPIEPAKFSSLTEIPVDSRASSTWVDRIEEDLRTSFKGISAWGMKDDLIYLRGEKKEWSGDGFLGLDGTLWQGRAARTFSSAERFLMEAIGESRGPRPG